MMQRKVLVSVTGGKGYLICMCASRRGYHLDVLHVSAVGGFRGPALAGRGFFRMATTMALCIAPATGSSYQGMGRSNDKLLPKGKKIGMVVHSEISSHPLR